MYRLRRNQQKASGLPPGSLIHVGEKKTDAVRIAVTSYDGETYAEIVPASLSDCKLRDGSCGVFWIHITGLHEPEVLSEVGGLFGIHPLVLEDILDTTHRPKMELHDDYLFIILKCFDYEEDTGDITAEQVSIILGERFVISFQESDRDLFQEVKKRVKNASGRIRKRGADYLTYALMDSLMDGYFEVLEAIEMDIEEADEALIASPGMRALLDIHRLKQEILFLRKYLVPIRDIAGRLDKSDTPFVSEPTRIYLRDLHDHALQTLDAVETFREMVMTLHELYHTGISNRMNEVMKLLTIISTIFIPLSFITGVYGMNFKYMPELEMKWAYAVVWGVILCVGGAMLAVFKRKGWF